MAAGALTLAAGHVQSRENQSQLNATTLPSLTSAEEIAKQIEHHRPLAGATIPADLADRLGATHYDGRYHLTDEPFLLEGCRALRRLGMNVVKLWLAPRLPGYGYHSKWDLPKDARLVDVARHPYFESVLAMPFSTFVFEIQPVTRTGRPFPDAQCDYSDDTTQLRELAEHLLRRFADRDVTFVLQHWEGDWMLRRSAGLRWTAPGPDDAEERCEGFIRWLAARQHGVEQARETIHDTRCQVLHAAEVNRVWDAVEGIPTLTSHVLPKVGVDLVSWSSYDGMSSAERLWQGIEIIRHHAKPGPLADQPRVFIGEIGIPEHGKRREDIVRRWDEAMGVLLAQRIPWVLHWQLYCNEPIARDKADYRVRTADEMRGFWLVRPDGSLSFAGRYLKALLDHAGETLPENFRTSFGLNR